MSARIFCRYDHTEKGGFQGSVEVYLGQELQESEDVCAANLADFLEVLSLVANEHAEAAVWLLRVDNEGVTQPLQLDDAMAKMLRKDPHGLAAHLEKPRATKVVRRRAPTQAGLDMWTRGFGSLLYVPRNAKGASCPLCSKQSTLAACPCGRTFALQDVTPAWACVKTEDLLNSSSSKFYLPQLWWGTNGWVKRDTLRARYEQFLKEIRYV